MVISTTDREVFQVKRAALEAQRTRTLNQLDTQIAALELNAAAAKAAGALRDAVMTERAVRKLVDVRADAFRQLTDAISRLSEQEGEFNGQLE